MEDCGSAVLQGSVIKGLQFADDKDLLAEEESQLQFSWQQCVKLVKI
jgi:hypothetical protein